jgi:hypothetical protein
MSASALPVLKIKAMADNLLAIFKQLFRITVVNSYPRYLQILLPHRLLHQRAALH